MGAGTWYTHTTFDSRAFWIQFNDEESTHCLEWYDTLINLEHIFEKHGYLKDDDQHYHNGLYNIVLESKYYGDGIVVRLENQYENSHYDEDVKLWNLAKANHVKCYDKLKRILLDHFELRIATSGYTSGKLEK